MANKLVLRDRRNNPWGNVNARVFWDGGGQDGVWVNASGVGEFKGSGTVSYIQVAGEQIFPDTTKADGSSTIFAKSKNAH